DKCMSWGLRKIRWAEIPKEDRDIFARFGEIAIHITVAGAVSSRTPIELMDIYEDSKRLRNAEEWLIEQGDLRERRETRCLIDVCIALILATASSLAQLAIIFGWIK